MPHTSRPSQGGRPKPLYFREMPSAAEYVPRLYLEARVDFADVRSGLNGTCTVCRAMEIRAFDPEDAWTEDMLWPVDPADIRTTPPDRVTLQPSPDWFKPEALDGIEARFVAHLLRTFRVTLFRNFDLNAYSRLNESREDFKARCLELLNETFRRDLDALRGVADRALERARERHLKEQDWAGVDSRIAREKGEFRDVAEHITSLFMHTELTFAPQEAEREFPAHSGMELQQGLLSLESDARHAVGKLVSRYQRKALNIDEYIIHPNFRDLHLVRSGLLWMPAEVR